MPRLLFTHGNLDVPSTFDSLLPLLPHEPKLCIDLLDTFLDWPADKPVNIVDVARQVAQQYAIGPDDVVIGHSMGGWIAAHVKAQTGATAVLLNSWTDPRKINAPIRRLNWLKPLVYSRLYQHRALITLAKAMYPIRASRKRVQATLDRLAVINPSYLFWQYQLIFNPAPPLTVSPDLRIHTRRDPVVRPPDQPFVLVPGDHVAHTIYPNEVAVAINAYLTENAPAS